MGNMTHQALQSNPFNPTAYISIQAERAGTAQVEIFDINGRKVFERDLNVNYSSGFVWDASKMSSGLYLVRVQMQNETMILQINLVK